MIDCHPAESDEDSIPEGISDTNNWWHRSQDLDDLYDGNNNGQSGSESDIVPDNCIEDTETLEQQDVSAAPNVPRLIWPIQRSKTKAEIVLLIVNTMETRRNEMN
jgi:hypothetical protein